MNSEITVDIIDEVTVHQCELKVGYTCTTL